MTYATHPSVDAYIAGWNAHDGDAVRAAFAPEGRAIDPVYPSGVSGAALARSVHDAVARLGDVCFTVTSEFPAGPDRVAFEWTLRANVVAPDGRRVPVTLSGVDVCDLRDGKIVELRGYFDRGTIPDQVAAASRTAAASVAASAG